MTGLVPAEIAAFLHCATPDAWYREAARQLDVLLIDHANCEKKAASTALAMLYRYVDRPDLLYRMSRLAREELRHFEQVHALMERRQVGYRQLGPGRYARSLMSEVRSGEPERLVDVLLVGAIVEARSCERFAGLVPLLPADISELYAGLLASEARHFRHYLALADRYGDTPDVAERRQVLLRRDAELVSDPDPEFRFHSGVPADP